MARHSSRADMHSHFDYVDVGDKGYVLGSDRGGLRIALVID